MASIRSIFDLETPYEEDKEKFYEFMENNCEEFFSNVGNTRYKVPYLLIKSVINENRPDGKGNKHRQVWKKMMNNLNVRQQRNNYQNYHKSTITKMLIDQSQGSYQKLMNLIQEYLKDFDSMDWKFNAVKYTYENQYLDSGNFVIYGNW